MKKILSGVLMLWACNVQAQFANDAVMVPQRGLFANLSYSNSSFEQIYQAKNLVSNANSDKFISQNVNLKLLYGPVKRLNIGVSLPYVKNADKAGRIIPETGFQDISGLVKLSILDPEKPLSIVLSGEGSRPLKPYSIDNRYLALGNGSESVRGGLNIRYKTEGGFFIASNGGYRSSNLVKLSRDNYWFNDSFISSSFMKLPNVIDYGIKTGFLNKKYQFEVFGNQYKSETGDQIPVNGSLSFANKLIALEAGIYGRIQLEKLGFNFKASQIVKGENTPKTLSLSAGIIFQLNGKSDRFEY
jgi:hypothetical protein